MRGHAPFFSVYNVCYNLFICVEYAFFSHCICLIMRVHVLSYSASYSAISRCSTTTLFHPGRMFGVLHRCNTEKSDVKKMPSVQSDVVVKQSNAYPAHQRPRTSCLVACLAKLTCRVRPIDQMDRSCTLMHVVFHHDEPF